MADIATLAFKVDSTQVPKGVAELDKLTAAGAKTEAAVDKVGTTSARAGAQIKTATGEASAMAGKAQEVAASWTRADIAITALGAATAQAKAELAGYKAALASGIISQAEYERNILQTKAALGGLQAEHRAATAEYSRLAVAQSRSVVTGTAMVGSIGAQRAGMQQLSFQLGDVATMFAMGAKPAQIFASQIGQVTQAVQLMSGGTSRLAAFLGGPWGIAIFAGVTVLGALIPKLFETKKAMEDVKFASHAMGDAQGILGKVMDMTTGKINTQVPALLALARAQILVARVQAQARATEARRGVQAIQDRPRELTGGMMGGVTLSRRQKDARDTISEQVLAGTLDGSTAVARLENLRRVGKLTDDQFAAAAASVANLGMELQNSKVFDQAEKALNGGGLGILAKPGGGGTAGRSVGAATGKAFKDEFEGWVENALESAAGLLITGSAEMQKAFTEAFNAAGDADLAVMFASIHEPADAAIERARAFGEALLELQDIAGEIDFGSIFGRGGEAIDGMIDAVERLNAAQSAHGAAIHAAGKDQAKIAQADAAYGKAKVNGTLAMIGATKSLFKEQSAGYQVLAAAEKAYAAVQLVQTGISVAAGAAKMFASLGPFAFPVVAAMVAVMAGLGFSGGSSAQVAPPSSQDLQDAAGTGSVLGDATAKSESIANALELVAENSNRDLEYTNQMLRALRSIDTNIGALSGNIAQQISVSGSLFDTSNLNIGSSGSAGFLGLFSSSTTRELWDAGIRLSSATVGDIIAQGITGNTYQIVQQIKKSSGFLGIGGGTKTTYQTTNGQIGADILASIVDVVASLRNGLVEASRVIGLEGAEAMLNGFQVSLGTISFKGLTGAEIEEQLNAVFSKVGDDMAAKLLPALSEMQQIGEGMFETFVRAARQYQVVDMALASIGKAFGAVGVSSLKARDELVQLFGSLDEFASQTEFFGDKFLTEAERIAPVLSAVRAELARLGLSGVTTRDQFKAAVLGLDLTTTAGREMYASLLAVAPAFDKVAKHAEDAMKTMADGFKKTVAEFAGYAASLTKYRDALRMGNVSQGNAYDAARRAFGVTADLAASGSATGLAGLEGAGKTFLEASRANAGSLVDYQRDVARVANAVDKGIFAATATADYAQLQLDALTHSASILASIDSGIANVQTLLGGSPAAPAAIASPGASPTAPPAEMTAENRAMLAENKALLMQVAENTSQLARLWSRIDGDGMLVRTDTDTPLQVEVVV